MSLDRKLFVWLNGLAGEDPLFDSFVRLLVNEYSIPVALALGVLFLWFGARTAEEQDRWQRAALVTILAVGVANLMVMVINLLWQRPRPFHKAILDMLFYRPTDPSFPANVAALGFAIATGVWLYDRRASWCFWVAAAVFSVCRIIAGVHYPLDVLGGAVVGIGAALLSRLLLEWLRAPILLVLSRLRSLGLA